MESVVSGTPESVESVARKQDNRLEVIGVILLSIASLLTAWSGYQSQQWGGTQTDDYNLATKRRDEAAQIRSVGYLTALAELSLFNGFVDATLAGDKELADRYPVMFREDFRAAFDAWLEMDPFTDATAPRSPVGMPEYQFAGAEDAAKVDIESEQYLLEASQAGGRSDRYVLMTVVFATVLFFSGLGSTLDFRRLRLAMLSFSALLMLAGLIYLVTQPVQL